MLRWHQRQAKKFKRNVKPSLNCSRAFLARSRPAETPGLLLPVLGFLSGSGCSGAPRGPKGGAQGGTRKKGKDSVDAKWAQIRVGVDRRLLRSMRSTDDCHQSRGFHSAPTSRARPSPFAGDRGLRRFEFTVRTLINHARYYWWLLAESHLTRRLFGAMLGRTATLPLPAG